MGGGLQILRNLGLPICQDREQVCVISRADQLKYTHTSGCICSNTLVFVVFKETQTGKQTLVSKKKNKNKTNLLGGRIPKNRLTNGRGSKPMAPFWGRCTTHFRTYFSGWIESDVHWGPTGVLTHGQLATEEHPRGLEWGSHVCDTQKNGGQT